MSNRRARRGPQEIAAAIRDEAGKYEGAARGAFLAALARTIETGRTSTGNAEGRYLIVWSMHVVTVQCENTAQTGWVEALCHTVKINFLTPHNRAHERELQI